MFSGGPADTRKRMKQIFESSAIRYLFLAVVMLGMLVALGGAFLTSALSFICASDSDQYTTSY